MTKRHLGAIAALLSSKMLINPLAIQAPSQPPQVHPHDRILLRPLATLGKPQVSGASVSFLRRTEYISNANTSSKASLFHKNPRNANNNTPRPPKRKSPSPEAGTPAHIRRKIERSFEAATENLKDKSRVKHPTKRPVGKNKGLKVVEAYPVLPDLDAFPDAGTYVTYKFAHPPVSHSKGGYDKRLQNSILKFMGRNETEEQAYQEALHAHLQDPTGHPKPADQNHYELYLAENLSISEKLRAKFDLNNPNRDDESLNPGPVTSDGNPAFSYSWARSYLATIESEGSHDTKYDEEIGFAFDPETKTAWYYPLMQRNRLEPPRRIYNAEQRKRQVDGYELTPVDPNEEIRDRIEEYHAVPRFKPQEAEEADEDQAAEHHASQNGDESPRRADSDEPEADRARRYDSEERREESEQDAEGDEDE